MSYFVHPRKAFGNEDVIYKARQYENALQERVQFVQQYERLMRYAQFEQLNGPRSSHRSLAEKLAAMREEREQALLHRRHKLSMLLATEDRILQNEIKTGNLNLSERRAWLLSHALALSSQRAPETNLEKALQHEDYNEVSALAIKQTEAERKRQRDNIATSRQSLFEHGLIGTLDGNEEAIDILRRHLFMVEQLREAERAAVEEDMVRMHRTWLEEEEALKLKQLEQRHHDSLQAKDLLLHKTNDKRSSAREAGSQEHLAMVAMAADRETEEEKQLEELRADHRSEAVAYVWQLKAAAERQRIEDEELQATIKATMSHGRGPDIVNYKDPQPNSCSDLGTSKSMSMASTDCSDAQNVVNSDAVYDTKHVASALSKKELADVLEGQVRGSHAAELVDSQEANRLAGGDTDYMKKLANAESRMKQSSSSMELPYPEPYYGRKAVNWYE